MTRPVIALVGTGTMGASHARIISDSSHADLGLVIDIDAAAAERLGCRHWARVSDRLDDAFTCDAAVIASSTAAHVECAAPFLERGIPVFLEKPLAPTLAEVDTLLELAEKTDTPLMCGFVERFNAAFRAAEQQIDETPVHLLAIRHSPPAPRIAASVVGDMLLHDLDVAVRLFGGVEPSVVGACCHRPEGHRFNEIADCTLQFPSGMASLSANRLAQRKVRLLTVHTHTKSVEVDLLRQDVTVYRNMSQEMTHGADGLGYRSSTEIDLPFVRHVGEPLALQFEHFMSFVDGRGDHAAERRQIRAAHALMEAIESPPAKD